MKKWLASSQDPAKVSQTIRGGITAVSSLIMFFALNLFGIEITQANIINLASYAGMVGGGIYGLAGLIMKIVMVAGKE